MITPPPQSSPPRHNTPDSQHRERLRNLGTVAGTVAENLVLKTFFNRSYLNTFAPELKQNYARFAC